MVVSVGVLILGCEPSLPVITRADLATAEARWQKQGPASYSMDLMIGGRRPGPVHIEVRDGKVTRMTRDGVTPSQPRTWEYWTVPEQFETIRQDFDSAETAGGFGAAPGTQTILKAEFDPQYGYPRVATSVSFWSPKRLRSLRLSRPWRPQGHRSGRRLAGDALRGRTLAMGS